MHIKLPNTTETAITHDGVPSSLAACVPVCAGCRCLFIFQNNFHGTTAALIGHGSHLNGFPRLQVHLRAWHPIAFQNGTERAALLHRKS